MSDGLPIGWASASLDNLGIVERGRSRHRPRNAPFLYGGKYPFIQTGDVKAAGLRVNVYSQTYNDFGLAQSRMWPTGTLCITIAANICETAILGLPACFPDSIVGFTANTAVADTLFVKYALDHQKRRFSAISQGTTQENLSVEKMLSQRFPVPPLAEQRRIASILSAYDDLIEVNRRRVAILEEMARRLFEEWFVHLRFPGHETVPVHDTPDGLLPEGWTFERVDSVAELKSGEGKLTKAAYVDAGYTAYSASGPDGFLPSFSCSGPAVIVSGVGAYCGRTWLASGNWTGIANTFYLRSIVDISCEYLFLATRGMSWWPRRGAAQPFIARGDVAKKLILLPSSRISSLFTALASPIMALVAELAAVNTRLAAARDLLLPRLISGELSVADAPAPHRLLAAAD